MITSRRAFTLLLPIGLMAQVGRRAVGVNPGPAKDAIIFADTSTPSSLREMFTKAEVIVVGTIDKAVGRDRPGSDTIETDLFVSVSQVLKGADRIPNNKLIVMQLGGKIDDRVLEVAEEKPIAQGETYVLSLVLDRRPVVSKLPVVSGTPRFQFLGGWNGQFKITNGKVNCGPLASPGLKERNGSRLDDLVTALRSETN